MAATYQIPDNFADRNAAEDCSDLTPAIALKELVARPLAFGDRRQLGLCAVLADAEALIGLVHDCPDCGGFGDNEDAYCSRCGKACSHCTDNGECRECKGSGETEWKREDVYNLSGKQITKALAEGRERMAEE